MSSFNDFFTYQQIRQIFKYIENKINTDKKHRKMHEMYLLIFQVMLHTGAFIEEILQITPKDINFNNSTIKLINSKKLAIKTKLNKKYREILMDPSLREAFMEYFQKNNISENSIERIFKTKKGFIDRYMKKMEKDLGFNINSKLFRYTFIVQASLNGTPCLEFEKLLGYRSKIIESICEQITEHSKDYWDHYYMNRIK